jgi:hypothetical protein
MPALWNMYFWWGSFLFLLPFFYVIMQHKIHYKHVYIWSACANAFHLSGVLIGIVRMAEGSLWQACIPALFMVAYAALFGLSILFVVRVCESYVFFKIKTKIMWSYVVAFWTYFLLMDHISMFPFDTIEGYFLLHPLLPLAVFPSLLRLLPWLHSEGLCAVLLVTQASFFGMTYEKTSYWKKVFGVCALFWLLCVIVPTQKLVKPVWFEKVVAVPYVFRGKPSTQDMVQLAALFLKDVAYQFQKAVIFVMPEGSFYADCLSNNTVAHALTKQYLDRPIHLLTGSFTWEGTKYRNTLYWLHDGIVQAQFHKTHAMVLTEKTPSWFRFKLIHELYFKNFNEIIPSQNVRPLLTITDYFSVVPYICSELFFAKRPRDCFKTCSVYALCNDRWTVDYIKLLMLRVAQYKAIEWQRPVMYVSFAYQYYIDSTGSMISLQRYEASNSFVIQ